MVWTGDGCELKLDDRSVSDISEVILSKEQSVSDVLDDDILYTGEGHLLKHLTGMWLEGLLMQQILVGVSC